MSRATLTDLMLVATTAELNALRAGIIAGSACAPAEWTRFRVADGLMAGAEVAWNGEAFSTVHGELLIARKDGGIASKTSSNTTEDADASVVHKITVPGFLMGKRSILNIETEWAHTDAATLRRMVLKAGGTVISSMDSPFRSFPPENVTFLQASIENLGGFTSQYCSSAWSSTALEVDTLADFDIEFSVPWDAAANNDTLTLQGYKIKLQP